MNQNSNTQFWLKLAISCVAMTLLTIAFMTKSYQIGYHDGVRDARLALTNDWDQRPGQ